MTAKTAHAADFIRMRTVSVSQAAVPRTLRASHWASTWTTNPEIPAGGPSGAKQTDRDAFEDVSVVSLPGRGRRHCLFSRTAGAPSAKSIAILSCPL